MAVVIYRYTPVLLAPLILMVLDENILELDTRKWQIATATYTYNALYVFEAFVFVLERLYNVLHTLYIHRNLETIIILSLSYHNNNNIYILFTEMNLC